MVRPHFIREQYVDSYTSVRQQVQGISHNASVQQPPFDGNTINWILGHLVVSRCNFLMLLGVPSIWRMAQCRRFMPGSPPVTGDADSVPLASLLADYDRTQEQLLEALARLTAGDLEQMKGDQTLAETLVFYQAHESYHAGQLELLRQLAENETST
jgi:hypothetical protein